MKKILFALTVFLGIVSLSNAADYQIGEIKSIFNKATPGFGGFSIQVPVKNNTDTKSKISVVCLYVGLTKPGVYFKNEPIIERQYKVIEMGPFEEKDILFKDAFKAYHPETHGEIIVSIIESGVVESLHLETSFHPDNTED